MQYRNRLNTKEKEGEKEKLCYNFIIIKICILYYLKYLKFMRLRE